ncbi:MAG: response regulator transcription factor [Anaerolineae bacterium]
MFQRRSSDPLLAGSWGLRYGFHPSPYLLLVEDEGHIARTIAYQLEHLGYEVLSCGRVCEAQELIEQIGLPHGAIIDLTLPDTAGDALCKWMNTFSDIPTIVLLPANAPEAELQSIRTYADEWLRKPLELCHLIRRMQWLMHHLGDSRLPSAPLVQVDDALAVDFVHQHALFHSGKVPLSPLETKIMHILMRRAGCVVTTDFLTSRLERATDANGVTEETVHAVVKMLQQKLEGAIPGARYIHVVAPSGYLFAQPEKR